MGLWFYLIIIKFFFLRKKKKKKEKKRKEKKRKKMAAERTPLQISELKSIANTRQFIWGTGWVEAPLIFPPNKTLPFSDVERYQIRGDVTKGVLDIEMLSDYDDCASVKCIKAGQEPTLATKFNIFIGFLITICHKDKNGDHVVDFVVTETKKEGFGYEIPKTPVLESETLKDACNRFHRECMPSIACTSNYVAIIESVPTNDVHDLVFVYHIIAVSHKHVQTPGLIRVRAKQIMTQAGEIEILARGQGKSCSEFVRFFNSVLCDNILYRLRPRSFYN
jgi:hypothetical protein